MVEEAEDPAIVTERLTREMRYANEAYIRQEEDLVARRQSLMVENVGMGATEIQQVAPNEPEPADAETAFRHGRLAVVAVIVVILFWAWVKERQSSRKERGVQNGRYGQ